MKHTKKAFFLMLTIPSLVATSVLASGSFSSSTRSLDDYNQGKAITHKKVTCSSCPFPASKIDKDLAQSIVGKINAGDPVLSSLSSDEQQVVVMYFRKRFELE